MVSRRTYLKYLSSVSVVGTAGCQSQNSNSRNPVTVGRIDIGNLKSQSVSISVLLKSKDEIIYWNTFHLPPYDPKEGQESSEWDFNPIVEGPWQEEPAVIDALIGYVLTEDESTTAQTTQLLKLGKDHKGCVTLQIDLLESSDHIRTRVLKRDQPCYP
jgi:hypothetical protein